MKPIRFRLGNGAYLIAEKSIRLEIMIQGHRFKISALVVDNLTGIDLILGTQTLSELEGTLDFKFNVFKIKHKKVTLTPTTKVIIKPGETKYLTLKGKVPPMIRNAEVIIRSGKHLARVCPTEFMVRLHRGRIDIPVTNPTQKNIQFDRDRYAASVNLSDLVNVAQPLPAKEITNILHHAEKVNVAINSEYNEDLLSDVLQANLKKYPHLNANDPIASMTESEIFHKHINLSDSVLNSSEKNDFHKFLSKHRDAFSLYGELSSCPNFEVDFTLKDEKPFFIKPYFTTERDKATIENELEKLVKLGILEVGHQPYTSPVLVLSKKGSSEKRVVTDFRFLNSLLDRKNGSFKLLSETLKTIGHSDARVISVMDLKSAFHCLPLSGRCQKYTGVASFHGGKHYFYKRLAMGLNVSSTVFQSKIDEILAEVPGSRTFCIAHHDDLIIFSPDKSTHRTHLSNILEALAKHGLRVSPSKAKLFRDSVIYMGHRITISPEGATCIQPLNDRCAAINNMRQPTTPKEVKRFIGAVNYVSAFFPNIQRHLLPLHQLTRKGHKFKWAEKHQIAYDKIRELMTSPKVLHLPRKQGRIRLYSDTSRVATGSYITQVINGNEQILGYYSKVLPNACQRYSVSELELMGLFINVTAFKYLLRGTEFDAFVDHSALVQIVKSKNEPCTNRLRKLLLKLSDYTFQLGYQKGSDLVLADFLSRAPRDDDSEIERIEPISFAMLANQLLEHKEMANPITRAYAKKHGIEIPAIFQNTRKQKEPIHTQNNVPLAPNKLPHAIVPGQSQGHPE